MNINDLKESKYLKRNDVGDGTIVTITGWETKNVAKENEPEEIKCILHFEEFDKGLVLNSTNAQIIAGILKSEETDDWKGGKVVLYDDPNISFGGKLTGGIRARAVPKAQAMPARTQAAAAAPAFGGSFKISLKNKFKNHPEFGKSMTADSINAYLLTTFGSKMDGLTEDQAKDALASFDEIATAAMDDIPF